MDSLAKKRFLVKDPRKEKLSLEDLVDELVSISEDLYKIELSDNLDATRRVLANLKKFDQSMINFRDRIRDVRDEILLRKLPMSNNKKEKNE